MESHRRDKQRILRNLLNDVKAIVDLEGSGLEYEER